MSNLTIILWIIFALLLINAPVYLAFRCEKTNWEWRISRLPLWKGILCKILANREAIEVHFAIVRWKTKKE